MIEKGSLRCPGSVMVVMVSVRAVDVAVGDFVGGRLAYILHFCLEADGQSGKRVPFRVAWVSSMLVMWK